MIHFEDMDTDWAFVCIKSTTMCVCVCGWGASKQNIITEIDPKFYVDI